MRNSRRQAWEGPAPDRRRGLVFAVATLVVLGTAIGLEAAPSPAREADPVTVEPAPTVAAPDPAPRQNPPQPNQHPLPTHSDPWTLTGPEKRHIDRVARAWMRPLMDFRFGHRETPPRGGPFVDPRLAAAITRTTFPLAERRARLDAQIAEVEFGRYRRFVSVWMRVRAGGVEEDHYLTLTRGARGWRVSDWNEVRDIAQGLRHGATE